jgi:hypothetical protein
MIDSKLLKAYQDTKFIISARDGEITLRVGEASEPLDTLLREYGAKSCEFITAWNPGSIKLTDQENAARQSALLTEIQRRGYALLRGRGEGTGGNWPPEDSVLILGTSRTEAVQIGELFGQLCIVHAELGCPVELLFCKE